MENLSGCVTIQDICEIIPMPYNIIGEICEIVPSQKACDKLNVRGYLMVKA